MATKTTMTKFGADLFDLGVSLNRVAAQAYRSVETPEQRYIRECQAEATAALAVLDAERLCFACDTTFVVTADTVADRHCPACQSEDTGSKADYLADCAERAAD